MRLFITTIIITCLSISCYSQFWITGVTSSPSNANDCDIINVTINGNLSSSNCSFVSSHSITGAVITIDVNVSCSGIGLPVITPYNETVILGMIPSNNYTLIVNQYSFGGLQETNTSLLSVGSCCSTVYVIDTLNTNVADIQYQNISPHTYLAMLDTFPQFSNPNCDSIISTYRQFIYNPNYCTDTILTYDTIFNQIYDTTTAYDTLITYDTLTTYDTVFNQIYDTTIVFDTLNISVIDTSYISISVTDTLYIDITVTGMTSMDNTITVYPNPANDVVIIDNGNYSIMNNYNLMIFNSLSQQVFFSPINTQQFQIPVSSLGAEGTYIIRIFDSSNNIVKTKYLILN